MTNTYQEKEMGTYFPDASEHKNRSGLSRHPPTLMHILTKDKNGTDNRNPHATHTGTHNMLSGQVSHTVSHH